MDAVSFFFWYLLLFVAILFTIFGCDNIIIDLFFWTRFFYRKWKVRKYKKLTYHDLQDKPEQKVAILIPCWQEHEIIGHMLRHDLAAIDYNNYELFVGIYPNDPETIAIVKKLEKMYTKIHHIMGDQPGPSSKAENLNQVYKYLLEREKKLGIKYDIVVLQDSEEIIHPWSLKLYNYLIPRKQMVQLPIVPLKLPHHKWTHWTYCDEFAEAHTKELIAREALNGFVPSAGTSTAFAGESLKEITEKNNGAFFTAGALTEDYDIALRLQLAQHKAIFVLQYIPKIVKKRCWYLFGKMKYTKVKELIAGRALFPVKYRKAVKQRSRWLFGIAVQEWHKLGWPGSLINKFYLWRDRKSIITFVFVGLGYITLLYWIIVYLISLKSPFILKLGYFINLHPWSKILIIICTIVMLDRFLQRAIASTRMYGLIAGITSIPRTIYNNLITFHVGIRTYQQMLHTTKKSFAVKWAKTENRLPVAGKLNNYRMRFGDIALQKKYLTLSELKTTLKQQNKSGRRIGDLLLEKQKLTKEQLLDIITTQHRIQSVKVTKKDVLPLEKLENINNETYSWLIENQLFPLEQTGETLTIGVTTPEDRALLYKARELLDPNTTQFLYIDWQKD